MDKFDFQKYLADSAASIVSDAMKAVLKDPRETAFLAKFALSVKKASDKRLAAEKNGEHIPSYLIASITSRCNLHCAGCYSRSSSACTDDEPTEQLSGEDWDRIFTEAQDIGISFILLAGGEPLLRKDVITAAAGHHDILFPIFTNGYFVGDSYLDMFDKNRNLLPIISIEGGEAETDKRRGEGTYRKITESMRSLSSKGIIFGTSVTVTTENLQKVCSDDYVRQLRALGCRAMIFVEYVPVTPDTESLAIGEPERAVLQERIMALRTEMTDMMFLAFPGDEKLSEGCTAAGRGFFHINSHGGAEPCPFSPYSDINVRETSLREAVNSKLFSKLRDEGFLDGEHIGGCVLFEKRDRIEQYLAAV